jgi:low temperature requirement protein LtrA
MTEFPDSAATAGPIRRVGWIELFFDLAFVAFITQLAHLLHGSPGPAQFLVVLAWSLPAWWAWTNMMATVNVLPVLPERPLGIALLAATALVGVMAASVSESTERAWAYALASAGLRLILLVLWLYRAHGGRLPLWRPILYNGVTAAIWVVSAFLPTPVNFALWGVAILIEVLQLRVRGNRMADTVRVDVPHGSERLGLFMIILIGESLLSVIIGLGTHWNPASAVAALIGFVGIAFLAWGFFVAGGTAIEDGLARLSGSGNITGVLDTVLFLPYLLVFGVTMLAAGLSTVVADPVAPLSIGAAVCLDAGVALFHLTIAIVSLRYGAPLRVVAPWAIPGTVLPLAVLTLAGTAAGFVSLTLVTVVIVLVVVIAWIDRRRRERLGSTGT